MKPHTGVLTISMLVVRKLLSMCLVCVDLVGLVPVRSWLARRGSGLLLRLRRAMCVRGRRRISVLMTVWASLWSVSRFLRVSELRRRTPTAGVLAEEECIS